MKKLILILTISAFLFGCTENQRVKMYGGKITINIPKGYKVTNITWKNNDLWYSYRPFTSGEEPLTTYFVEESNFGMMEGKVTFVESRQ